jgi:hypothetical protein
MADVASRKPFKKTEEDYKHLSWISFFLAIIVPTIYLISIF